MISKETATKVKESLVMEDILADYLELKNVGSRYWSCCPFHDEKTPSFCITPEMGLYKCFGCGEKGDTFDFLEKKEGMSYPEALEFLAEKLGIDVTYSSNFSRKDNTLLKIMSSAQDYFKGARGAQANDYIRARRFDSEVVEGFDLGWAPKDWGALRSHLRVKGFSMEDISGSGLFGKSSDGGIYDRFRGRLIFPLKNSFGKVVGFGGRLLEDSKGEAKYLNSGESALYKKSKFVYGIFESKKEMRKAKSVYVVEGYFDLLACHSSGIRNCVACCGTAFTEDHAKKLKQYVEKVIFCFDGDLAGRKAMEKAIKSALAIGLKVEVVALEMGTDPDSTRLKLGPKGLKNTLQGKQNWLNYLCASKEGSSIEADVDRIKKLAGYIGCIRGDKIRRSIYVKRLADLFGLKKEEIEEHLNTNQSPQPVLKKKMLGGPPPEFFDTNNNRIQYAERLFLKNLVVYWNSPFLNRMSFGEWVKQKKQNFRFENNAYFRLFIDLMSLDSPVDHPAEFLRKEELIAHKRLLVSFLETRTANRATKEQLEKIIMYQNLAMTKSKLEKNTLELERAKADEVNALMDQRREIKDEISILCCNLDITMF